MGGRGWPDETTRRSVVYVAGDDTILLKRKAAKIGGTGDCFDPPVSSLSSLESKSIGEQKRMPVAQRQADAGGVAHDKSTGE